MLSGQPGLGAPQHGSPEQRGTGSPQEALGTGTQGNQCLTLLKGLHCQSSPAWQLKPSEGQKIAVNFLCVSVVATINRCLLSFRTPKEQEFKEKARQWASTDQPVTWLKFWSNAHMCRIQKPHTDSFPNYQNNLIFACRLSQTLQVWSVARTWCWTRFSAQFDLPVFVVLPTELSCKWNAPFPLSLHTHQVWARKISFLAILNRVKRWVLFSRYLGDMFILLVFFTLCW